MGDARCQSPSKPIVPRPRYNDWMRREIGNRLPMTTWGVSLSLLALGCVPAPQSRQEFVTVVGRGTSLLNPRELRGSATESSIEKTLREKSTECFNKTEEKWGAGAAPGSRTKSTSTYVSQVERNPKGQLELTLRVRHNPRGIGSPPDGVFLLAADMANRGQETVVDLYAATFPNSHFADAVRAWVRGQQAPCPPLD